jgi:small multidrug resistance pump
MTRGFRPHEVAEMPAAYLQLAVAIVSEVIATSALKASDGFGRPLPAIMAVVGYGIAIYLLAQTMRAIPVGVVYAVWSGTGIVLIALIGLVVYRQTLDLAAIAGLGLIIAGVLVVNLLSRSVVH